MAGSFYKGNMGVDYISTSDELVRSDEAFSQSQLQRYLELTMFPVVWTQKQLARQPNKWIIWGLEKEARLTPRVKPDNLRRDLVNRY